MPGSREARRLAAGVAVAVFCVLCVLAARGAHRPWIPSAPAYRQRGLPDAKAVVVVFSDFQCPACATAVETLKRLESLYGDGLRVLYKHRPWEKFHPSALSAARAAECAGRQGKFWELHDHLYQNQSEWAHGDKADEFLARYARSIGLEPEAYARCLQDPAVTAAIRADMREADERWINSTPTFFINGRRFVGGRQLRIAGTAEIERRLGR